MKKQIDELNNKIINITKENCNYLSQIEELTKKLDDYKNKTQKSESEINLNIIDSDKDKLVNKINEISEKNIQKLNDIISPIRPNFINLEKNIDNLINNQILSFVHNKINTFDSMIKEKKDKFLDFNKGNLLFEENKKLIEELKEQKIVIIKNDNKDRYNDLKNENKILEERIKNLLEEQKASNELIDLKSKELKKAYLKIKNMEDKLYDISEFIKNKCKNEAFIRNLPKTPFFTIRLLVGFPSSKFFQCCL